MGRGGKTQVRSARPEAETHQSCAGGGPGEGGREGTAPTAPQPACSGREHAGGVNGVAPLWSWALFWCDRGLMGAILGGNNPCRSVLLPWVSPSELGGLGLPHGCTPKPLPALWVLPLQCQILALPSPAPTRSTFPRVHEPRAPISLRPHQQSWGSPCSPSCRASLGDRPPGVTPMAKPPRSSPTAWM